MDNPTKRADVLPILTREEVYRLIDGEREYQNERWSEDTTDSAGKHTPTEWLLYIDYYVQLAKASASTKPEQICRPEVMGIIRKIAAMGVAAMEQNGAPARNRD